MPKCQSTSIVTYCDCFIEKLLGIARYAVCIICLPASRWPSDPLKGVRIAAFKITDTGHIGQFLLKIMVTGELAGTERSRNEGQTLPP